MSKYIDYDAIDYRHYKLHDKSSEFLDGVIYMAERIENAPSYETKQIKYFDEEEKVWKIGDVIVEHTERTQEEIPEYEPWRDAFDGMDCCSMEVQDDNGDDID